MSRAQFVIVGGGITGLAAAWALEQLGTGERIVLFEEQQRLGGWIHTERWGDVLIEHGPDSWVAAKQSAQELVQELGLTDELIGLRPGHAGIGIVRDGAVLALPEGLALLAPTQLKPLLTSSLLSTPGKLRVLAELFLPRRSWDSDESLGRFVRRHFGAEFYERIVEPLLAGVYGGDPDELSLLATYPRFREMESKYGSLVRALWRESRVRPAGSPFLSLRRGMGQLIEALQQHLKQVEICYAVPVERLHRSATNWQVVTRNGEIVECKAVLLAVPAWRAADLVQPVDETLAMLLRSVHYISSAAVTLIYERTHLEGRARGRGILIPAREGRSISAITWVTNKLPDRAPENLVVVRVFFRERPEKSPLDQEPLELIRTAQQELAQLVGVRVDPLHVVVSPHRRALPRYAVGHRQLVEEVRSCAAQWPGLVLAGAAFDGVGIPDCIQSGRRAVALLYEQFFFPQSG